MEVTVDQMHLFPSHGHTTVYKTVVAHMPGGRVLPNLEGIQDLRTCYCVTTDAEFLPSTLPVVTHSPSSASSFPSHAVHQCL